MKPDSGFNQISMSGSTMTIRFGKRFSIDRNELYAFGAIFLLTFLIYWTSLGFDFLTTWDDPEYIVNNPDIRGLSIENIKKIFTTVYVGHYAPLHLLSYAIEYAIYGLDSFGFRLTNLILHNMNAFMVFLIIRKFSKNFFLATITSILFAVHPVQVETVAWATERKHTLSLFFFFLSFYSYISYAFAGYCERKKYLFSVITFLLAGLTKTVVIFLPALLLLYEVCFLNKFSLRKSFLRMLPFFLLSTVFVIIELVAQKDAIVPFHGGSPYATFLLGLIIVPKYMINLILPFNLSEEYFINIPSLSLWNIKIIISMMFLISIALATRWTYKKNKIIFFWISWYFINLILYLQILPIFTHMQDRFLYYSSIAPCFLFALLTLTIRNGLAFRPAKHFIVVLMVLLVGAFSLTSNKRTEVWRDSISLWTDAANKAPYSAMALVRLGDAYVKEEMYNLAIPQYIEAARLDPAIVSVHKNLANIYMKKGLPFKAIDEYKKTIEIEKADFVPYHNLGVLYFQTGNKVQAEAALQNAIRLNPYFAMSYYFLGKIYEPVDRQKAITYFSRGIPFATDSQLKATMAGSLRKLQFGAAK